LVAVVVVGGTAALAWLAQMAVLAAVVLVWPAELVQLVLRAKVIMVE